MILLCGSVDIGIDDSAEDSDDVLASEAAQRSTRIIEDMLAKDAIQYGQIHLYFEPFRVCSVPILTSMTSITCIFSTLCVHVLQMRHSMRETAYQLAEYRARICLMGLKELRLSWDANNWILELFYHFLDDKTAEVLHIAEMKTGRPSPRKTALPSRATLCRSTWRDTQASPNSATNAAGNTGDRTDLDTLPALPQAIVGSGATNLEANLDFMSELLSMREADDAFFDGTMDSEFTNAEMNVDRIFGETFS